MCSRIIISLFVLDTEGYHVNIKNRSLYLYDKIIFRSLYVQMSMVIIFCNASRDILNIGTNNGIDLMLVTLSYGI